MNSGVSKSEGKAALWSDGTAADRCVLSFMIQSIHCTDTFPHQITGALGGFNCTLQSLPVLSHI